MNIKKIRILVIALVVLLYLASAVSADSGPKVKFYANKEHYHDHDNHVTLTLKNDDKKKSITLPCDGVIDIKQKKEIKYKKGKKTYKKTIEEEVAEVPWEPEECSFDVYGDTSDTFTIGPRDRISQDWNKENFDGDIILGNYKAYTRIDHRTIHTDTFKLVK